MQLVEAFEMAEDRVLADLDTMADWLYGECIGKSNILGEYIKKNLLDSDEKSPEDLPTHQLFALMFSEHAATRAKATWVMRERYLAESIDRVDVLAAEYAAQN